MRIDVQADILLRLIGAASTEETRFYLNGVGVRTRARTNGVVLEATDGHILAIEHDENGEADGPVIVSAAAIADVARVVKAMQKMRCDRKTMRVTITAHAFRIYIRLPNGETNDAVASPNHTFTEPGGAFIDGMFPDVERVIPRPPEDGVPVLRNGFNPAKALQLAQTAKTLDKRNTELPCLFWQNGEGDPTLVRVAGAPNWLGVLMPMRADVGGPLPAWFDIGRHE